MIDRQMMLAEVPVNPSVKPEDELRLSRQALEVYKMLRWKPMWTSDLILPSGVVCIYCSWHFKPDQLTHINCQYLARLYEIRQALMPLGLTVDLTEEGESGNNKYEIVEFKGSRYQAHLRKRGIV